MQTGDIIMPASTHAALLAALASAATAHMPDLLELVDLNALAIALGEVGGVFPDLIRPTGEVEA